MTITINVPTRDISGIEYTDYNIIFRILYVFN